MSIELLSVLAALLAMLIVAFLVSLLRADKVDIHTKLGGTVQSSVYRTSNSRLGTLCQQSFQSGGHDGMIKQLASAFSLDLVMIQDQIETVGMEDKTSALEILVLKVLGIAGGLVLLLLAFMLQTMEICIGAFLVFIVLYISPMDKINTAIKERETRIYQELPLFIEQVYMCIEAGAPLQESLQTVAQKSGGEIGKIFSQAFVRAKYGGSWEDELIRSAVDAKVDPLEDFINDILISHSKGTSISETLRKEVDHVNMLAAMKNREIVNALKTKMDLLIFIFFFAPTFLLMMAPALLQAAELLG